MKFKILIILAFCCSLQCASKKSEEVFDLVPSKSSKVQQSADIREIEELGENSDAANKNRELDKIRGIQYDTIQRIIGLKSLMQKLADFDLALSGMTSAFVSKAFYRSEWLKLTELDRIFPEVRHSRGGIFGRNSTDGVLRTDDLLMVLLNTYTISYVRNVSLIARGLDILGILGNNRLSMSGEYLFYSDRIEERFEYDGYNVLDNAIFTLRCQRLIQIVKNELLKLKPLLAFQKQINEVKIPKMLHVLFQNCAPILYKSVGTFSKHEKGRLAGVAMLYDNRAIRVVLGRKALTEGDDKDYHIERELIKRLLPPSEHNGGYLFVYTPLPPCNTDTIGCLSFYRQLAQHNPNLRTIVMFDHEYEDGSNYTSLTTANFTMVNRVKAAEAIKQTESRKSSIAKMALTLTRATSDQIVSALQKKDNETTVEILKKLDDSERRKRLAERLRDKQIDAG